MLSPPADPATRAWMARNLVARAGVLEEAWQVLQLTAIACLLTLLALAFLAGPLEMAAGAVAAFTLPLVAASAASNRPARLARRESRSYLRHAPSAIGSMTMSMNLSPSLEKALLFASSVSRDPLGHRLRLASWEVLTRRQEDVESALGALASSLDPGNQSLKQSLHLMVASVHEPTKDGMERLMDKAHEVCVHGLRQAAERYLSSLSAPVTALFALGILLPIMLLSLSPLLALAGPVPTSSSQAVEGPPLAPVAFLLLVVAPAASFLYSRSLLEGSPTASLPELSLPRPGRRLMAWAAWAVAMAALAAAGLPSSQPQLFLLAAASSLALLLWPGPGRESGAEKEMHQDFIVGLYQLGNRLSSGASLERSLAEAAQASSGTEFSSWARAVLHAAAVGRRSLEEEVESSSAMDGWPLLAEAFRTVAWCAQSEGAAAGRVAVRLARSLGDVRDCQRGIEERLRGVVDMMRSTSLVFAPIVLGVTVGLFQLTSGLVGAEGPGEEVVLMAGLYLMELALVVSYFTTLLAGGRGWEDVLRSYARRLPVAMLAFTAVSLLSQAGFGRPW